uniref:Neuromedin B n=1 Tax=Gallus gallus TaxID=9031 RepID=A0A1D5PAZ6_CHICK
MKALRCFLLLLCGAALGPAVHLDFAEHRSQAAKIKVNPRGNLWATGCQRAVQMTAWSSEAPAAMPGLWGTRARCVAGHFMGKKSVSGTPHLDVPGQPAVPMAFGPSLRALLEDVVELLTRELLKILLQERLLDENRGKYDLTDQETGLLTKVLEKYFSN